MPPPLEPGRDFYWENGRMVLTEAFLRDRGYCCGNGCRHCPYRPACPASCAEPTPEGDACSTDEPQLS
jgi:hypothetical protein